MDFVEFTDVSFTYPPVEGDVDADGKQIIPSPIFDHFSAALPCAFTSIVGPNGCGKTTLMLLASGRLIPSRGAVRVLGQDIARLGEEKRNLLASVIYQNMEFERDDKVSALLSYVYSHGALKASASGIHGRDLFDEVVDTFELEGVMNHGLSEISKGENQRVLLAFCLLYGSASVFMDEPLFAMEDAQKDAALAYLREYSEKTKTPMFISMHDLDLTRKYAEKVLLMYPNRDMDYGTPDEVMTKEDLERAYGFPASMLKHHEDMTRQMLRQGADVISKTRKR